VTYRFHMSHLGTFLVMKLLDTSSLQFHAVLSTVTSHCHNTRHNLYTPYLSRQRHVWFIPLADDNVQGVRVKL